MPAKKDSKNDKSVASDQLIVTKEGLQALQDELNQLQTVGRKEIAEQLKEAISFGDLSENSEYEDAKTKQALMESRIIELTNMIESAVVVDETKHSKQEVEIGTKVTIQAVGQKTELEFTIVGSTESDPVNGRISMESPVGSALIGAKKGDTVEVKAPSGKKSYTVLKLS